MSLTIIFSTREVDRGFIGHLQSTVGVPGVQIVPYVNNNEFSLAQIYNRGLRAAENDIVVFLHDDIIFDNCGWGTRLLSQFRDTDFGILGVAGTTRLAKDGEGIIARWWGGGPGSGVGRVRHLVDGRYLPGQAYKYRGPVEVICLDGVFLAVDRNKIREIFDERFPGFHFYDLPFTFRNHLAGVKVGVTFEVNLTHKSVGVLSEDWNRGRIRFTELYGEYVPYSIPHVTGPLRYFDLGNLKNYVRIWYGRHIGWRFKHLK